MSAGRLKKNSLGIAMLLCAGLLLAGCSGSKSSDSGSGAVYTVKRGDTLYRISRTTGTSVNDLARLNGISPPYTIEVGQKLKLGGSKTASAKSTKKSSSKTAAVRPSSSVPQSSWPPVGQRCWQWPASGKVILPYSTAEGGNKGIDISAARGTPVYAAGAGKVVYVGNQLRGYGNLIMIKHGEDYITAYAHNDTMLVNNGQSVKAGQKIATMGSTDAASVRLHFQIRYRATAIDPQRYLPPQGSKPKC
ncbi:amidase activator ActS [Citrobacter farmeri]|uniref:amidase activator ActS n=1 Tax=Citrobacter farmeri TaxID=67824 RepID=UPI00189FB985|nr:amidase activator ActS [Citrobacter farmeri]MBU5646474.1 peptidoglycan DD-metalloendopeptidase family protein [Pluralibacter sp. S54_ASV_43]HAT3754213.1 peptidoglycan DD-metalloendopeptidase family protein [Citrobacter amalonaticus]HAU5702551.1 LysM peptidoglycan-binding domain-containing protein [Citrobacter freundii]EHK0947054.1 peptidoglycan DD-metalloendopeptidase family protein [Citrobacter farmeri]EKX4542536.1 peptidoglycan DD-metalloendopeptidase family protein [Citrobacter farmeri]